MANFNKVILVGNLTRDIEVRYTQSGAAVGNFGLAVKRKFKRQDGSDGEEVLFVDVTAWGRQAETLSKYIGKGSPLMVEGRLRLDTWEDSKTGDKRSKISVTLEQFQFLGGGKGEGGKRESREQHAEAGAPPDETDYDTIPF